MVENNGVQLACAIIVAFLLTMVVIWLVTVGYLNFLVEEHPAEKWTLVGSEIHTVLGKDYREIDSSLIVDYPGDHLYVKDEVASQVELGYTYQFDIYRGNYGSLKYVVAKNISETNPNFYVKDYPERRVVPPVVPVVFS
jgi:hypothetical protein